MSIDQIVYLCNHMDIGEKKQIADFLEIECVPVMGCRGCIFESFLLNNERLCPNVKCSDRDDDEMVIFKGNVK